MKTVKLYDADAYIKEFGATVLSCEKAGEFYKIILDRTCFFPEAGGQPSDTGTINGAAVSDVLIENGEIVHYCISPFDAGDTISGEIDFDRRFSFMQNHSGEHIVSGIVNRLFGFNNVGFHLNEEFVTLDFDGVLSKEELEKVEFLANKAVWEDRTVTAFYPSDEEINQISFRQKSEIEGEIRLVKIDGVDICACCAPHVGSTGQIGLIKFLSTEKMRGGIRIFMKCGEFALKDYRQSHDIITKLQNEFSVKPEEVYDGFLSFKAVKESLKAENLALKKKLLSFTAGEVNEKVAYIEGLAMPELQKLCDAVFKKRGATSIVFSDSEKGGYNLVIRGDNADEIFKKAKQNLDINGGGRNGMISCRVNTIKEDIIREFSK